MRWSDGFITVDWGTTNRRAWRIGAGGDVEADFSDDRGILSVPSGGFPAAVAELRARLGDLPMLLAGMIGSNRGWIEAPYLACPVGFAELAAALHWVEPGRTAIVPGVCYDRESDADVMRGEEVQILGAAAEGLVPPSAAICHPGTHSKWVRLEAGRITAFRTVMTGELFNLLKAHSILADLLGGQALPGDSFEDGARRGLERDELAAELFATRARVLLGKLRREDAVGFVSGLLIGADVRSGLRLMDEGEVAVMGRADLTRLFCAALALAGRSTHEVDGESAFLAGARRLAGEMG